MADERENATDGTVSVHHATGSTYLGPLKNGRCSINLKFRCQCYHVLDGGCGRARGMGKFTKSKVSFQFSTICNPNFVCRLSMHIIIIIIVLEIGWKARQSTSYPLGRNTLER